MTGRPLTPARTIDAAIFPHLIDQIFQHLPLKTLLALRLVCRSWKARATEGISYHLILEGDDEVSVTTGLASEGKFVFGDSDLAQCFKTQWCFASLTRVVDVVGPVIPRAVCGLLYVWELKNVHTMRFTSLDPIEQMGPPKMSLKRAVYFDITPTECHGYFYLNTFNATKVVIHLATPRDHTAYYYSPSRLLKDEDLRLREVVVVCHPWKAPQWRSEATGAARVEAVLEDRLGALLGIAESCRSGHYKLTVVGLESLNLEALGLETDHDLQGRSVERTVIEYARGKFRNPGKASSYLTFLRLEEYRKAVGEQEYEIEMEEKLKVPFSLTHRRVS